MAGLRCRIAPVGRYRSDDNAVSGLENPNFATDFVNNPDRLVSEGQVLARADCAVNRVRVGSANQGARGFDNRVVGPRPRDWFVDKADSAQSFHRERLHWVEYLFSASRLPGSIRF